MSSAVVDASALLALLNQEPGSARVQGALASGVAIGTVNLAEVVAKLAEGGLPEPVIRSMLETLGLEVVPFDGALAYRAGMLRAATRQLGLSLGDRACLALAERLGVPALTTDRAWATLQLGIAVQVVR